MYATCLFCTRALGHNAVLEAFPVGRRLAYDAAKGRLWVVCTNCQRWNLTPLEARWEAIEQAERLFRGTRLRASTGEVGLARVAAGDATVDLVRIGRPLRPELAAWRYGDRFGVRRRRALVRGGTAAVAGGAAVAGAVATLSAGAAGVAVVLLFQLGGVALAMAGVAASQGIGQIRGSAARWVPDGTGQWLLVSRNALPLVRLAGAGAADGGFQLRVPYDRRAPTREPDPSDWINRVPPHETALTGAPALEAARLILPLVNGDGAGARRVRDAVSVLESLGPTDATFAAAARRLPEWAARQAFGDTGALAHLPAEVRLALEMAANEDRERAALEGELAALAAMIAQVPPPVPAPAAPTSTEPAPGPAAPE